MEDSSGANKGYASPGRPHWRHRDPSATAVVYVVHPTQFRTVVQQLTGAPPPPAPGGGANSGGAAPAAAPAAANAAKGADAAKRQQRRPAGGKGGGGGRTLGQMHQECMAWAQADDDD